MASRYDLSARIDADYTGGAAFAEAIGDVKALNHELESLDNRENITVDVDTQVGGLERISDATTRAAHSTNLLADANGNLGMTFVTAARQLTASGFLIQLAAIVPAAAAALSALRPLYGSVLALGGLGAGTAAGIGLVVAASVRLWKAAQDGAGFTKRLSDEWKQLTSQFTGSQSVFDRAARPLAGMSRTLLEMANKSMPMLGREATRTTEAIQKAFQGLSRNLGDTERNSLIRILQSASHIMGDLTRAAGKAGGAIANILGNLSVVNAAKGLAGWLDKIADSFLAWSRSEKGIKTINGLVQDAQKFWKGLGEALKPVLESLGKFGSDDVDTLIRALKGTGRVIGEVIEGLENFWDWVGKAQQLFDEKNWQLKDFAAGLKQYGIHPVEDFIQVNKDLMDILDGKKGSVVTAIEHTGDALSEFQKALNDTQKDTKKWGESTEKQSDESLGGVQKDFKDTSKAMDKWQDNAFKNFKEWVRDEDAWYRNTSKIMEKWYKDQVSKVGKWATDTKKTFDTWIKNWNKSATAWHTGQEKEFDSWASDVLDSVQDAAGDMQKAWDSFMKVWNGDTEKGTSAVVDTLLSTLDTALGPLDEWVGAAIDILNKVFDLLGVGGGEEGSKGGKPAKGFDKPGSNPHSGRGQVPVKKAEGGITYMAAGGIIDSSGVYTALTTGMDEALSKGAVWEHMSKGGGVSDGMAPRVVYGEGRPGEGPKREGWVPEDMEPSRAMDTLSEIAGWFGAQVGFGGNRPHAHWVSEADRVMQGPGTFLMHEGGVLDRNKVHFMAPIDPEGNSRPTNPSNDPNTTNKSNIGANAGGYTLGVAPPNWILNTFMEYIPGYPYGNEHHLGVDVVPNGAREIHAPAAYAVTGQWDRSSYGEGTFLQYNAMTPEGQTYSAFAGHLGSVSAGSTGKPDQVMGSIGSYSGWGGGPDHMHLQTAPHPSPVGMDPGGLMDPFNFWTAVGGTTSIPSGSDSSSGFDYFGAAMNLLSGIGEPDLGSGPYFTQLASAAGTAVLAAAKKWVQAHVPYAGDTSRSSTGSGSPPGSLNEWAAQGLQYGGKFEASDSNISKIVDLAMKESGGDPNAVNASSGASGLMQMLVATFDAYRVATGDDIFNPVDNVAASSRYQLERYGGLVTFSPYTQGGIATRGQVASVAEHGPEFFMPLHDPESSRRFMNFLESAALERAEHGKLPWQMGEAPHRGGRYGSNEAVVKELRRLTRRVEDGIRVSNPDEVGDAAADGTIHRIPNTVKGREAVRRASRSPSSGRGTTGGRISP